MYILAIADRGLISYARMFWTCEEAERALAKYLIENESYGGAEDIATLSQWLREHDERLNVEIVEQHDIAGDANALTALHRIRDALYLDESGVLNFAKSWNADTLDAIADVVRSFVPQPPGPPAEDDDKELTPEDRAEFVSRIEQVSPYDEGLDAQGNMVSPSEFMTDLLTDIRHYCDARDVDFAACDRSAYGHYVAERHGEAHPAAKTQDMTKGGDNPHSQ